MNHRGPDNTEENAGSGTQMDRDPIEPIDRAIGELTVKVIFYALIALGIGGFVYVKGVIAERSETVTASQIESGFRPKRPRVLVRGFLQKDHAVEAVGEFEGLQGSHSGSERSYFPLTSSNKTARVSMILVVVYDEIPKLDKTTEYEGTVSGDDDRIPCETRWPHRTFPLPPTSCWLTSAASPHATATSERSWFFAVLL